MKNIAFVFVLLASVSCAQEQEPKTATKTEAKEVAEAPKEKTPHKYGGWYCPDNLNGFPAVDMKSWRDVPVISGRLPTKEETHTGKSLMYIDIKEYPNAKAMDLPLPQLAKYYNDYSKQEELIIVIQAVTIGNDSVVGFRYLNGGNGSARYNEVTFVNDIESAALPNMLFVSHTVKINKATQKRVWDVITNRDFITALQPTFKDNVMPGSNWRDGAVMNYYYAPQKELSNAYADMLFGCYYIQRDYKHQGNNYVEKFLLLENKEEGYTEMKIVLGPFLPLEYKKQSKIIEDWGKIVKEVIEDC